MARPAANLRLFVALYPTAAAARAMLDALAALRPADHRATPVDQVHMTLQFIGDVPARDLDAATESVSHSASGLAAFSLTPQRLITLPTGRHPRLVAAQTDAPAALLELHRRLAARLAHSVRARPDDRFRPHLTLCRFAHTARAAPLDAPLSLPPFAVEHILLMRSTLRPEGAAHDAVARFQLGGAA